MCDLLRRPFRDGRAVVQHGRLITADEDEIARDIANASRRMQEVVV